MQYSLNILVFIFVSSFAILSQKYQYSLDEDFLACLLVGFSVENTVGSVTGSGFGILSGFFIGNVLHLKLLRIFLFH